MTFASDKVDGHGLSNSTLHTPCKEDKVDTILAIKGGIEIT